MSLEKRTSKLTFKENSPPTTGTMEQPVRANALRRAANSLIPQFASHKQALLTGRTLPVSVRSDILTHATVGPFRKNFFFRIFRHLYKRTIQVESFSDKGLSAGVLYAPYICDACSQSAQGVPSSFVPTQLPAVSPHAHEQMLVCQGDEFEIRLVGMQVSAFDKWKPGKAFLNELLLYSVETDTESTGDYIGAHPFIHYDPDVNGSTKPDVFVPIPASKNFVTSSECKMSQKAESGDVEKQDLDSINVQFKLFELDDKDDTVKKTISGIDSLATHMSEMGALLPVLGTVSPALTMASSIGRYALDSYAKPDRVISIDMDFDIAKREDVVEKKKLPNGKYLQYGYYYFLSEPVPSKLYASIASSGNERLMMRRANRGEKTDKLREFVPLTDVSYLVVQVCKPSNSTSGPARATKAKHKAKLERFLRQKVERNASQVRQDVEHLAKLLGCILVDQVDGKSDFEETTVTEEEGKSFQSFPEKDFQTEPVINP